MRTGDTVTRIGFESIGPGVIVRPTLKRSRFVVHWLRTGHETTIHADRLERVNQPSAHIRDRRPGDDAR
jgi:hypothetical protein